MPVIIDTLSKYFFSILGVTKRLTLRTLEVPKRVAKLLLTHT